MGKSDNGGWGSLEVVSRYNTVGFSDRGEALAMAATTLQAQGAVLDIGVGGGRTTALLLSTARSYVGVEPEPEMITLARTRFPDADLRIGDVRDLGEFESGSFDLVVFSLNGIDALDHEVRIEGMREMSRVLAPGGRLVFSSLNRDGASCGERPWIFWRGRPTREVARRMARMVRHPRRQLQGVRNYRVTRRQSIVGSDWCVVPMRSHEFRFLVHYATVGATVGLLSDVGLVVEAAWDKDGRPVDPNTEHSDADYVHYVCRPA